VRTAIPSTFATAVALLVAASIGVACTAPPGGSEATPLPSTSVPIVTPASPYGSFPYANIVQRAALTAFRACAADHGVELRGPYADSQGNGVLFARGGSDPGSDADLETIQRKCPQFLVGMFATPDAHAFDAEAFEQAATAFARCLRSHGESDFPVPRFDGDDPYVALARLPFQWDRPAFVEAASACEEPLWQYVFPGGGG